MRLAGWMDGWMDGVSGCCQTKLFQFVFDNTMPFCDVNARVMTDLEECASYIFVTAAAQTKSESIFSIERQIAGLHD